MKLLVIFIDMVRVDQLNLFVSTNKETCLDRNLKQIGGTLFTKCYTPGPDTPRSNACMQTGLYPFFNGCDTRIKWPKYFIKDDVTTIFDHAVEKGYNINLCVRKHTLDTGLINCKNQERINYYSNFEEFVGNCDVSDNTLSYVYDPDWHTAVTDYHASRQSFYEGDKVVSVLFDKYLTQDYLDKYDKVIIYSDHGFSFQKESDRRTSKLDLLDDSRNKILLLIRGRDSKTLVKDDRLASMLDLYATMEDLIGGTEFRQGYSLLRPSERTVLHIEDHQDFKVYPEVMIKLWRVISNQYDIRTDGVHYTCEHHSEIFKEVEDYLSRMSPKYCDYRKQLNVWKHYEKLSNDSSGYYIVGLPRASKCVITTYKVLMRLQKYAIKYFHIK